MDPAALKYAASHEWIHLDGDIATIGISDFAVHQLTDLVLFDVLVPGIIGKLSD